MKSILKKFISMLALSAMTVSASAGVMSYRVDLYGNITGSTDDIRHYGDYQDGYWTLNDANNTISSSRYGGIYNLNTSLFSVSDILNVTFSNTYNNMWVDIGGPINYSIDRFGNINGSSSSIRHFGDYQDGYWTLDDANNTIRSSRHGGTYNLNTSLFSVSDILDVTYSNAYNNMWVDIGGPVNYSIDRFGNINGSSSSIRHFGDYQDGYWTLDDVNNTIRSSLHGGTYNLNTSLFSVSDILDVTYSNAYNFMWVTVDNTPTQQVDEPSALALLGLGLFGLVLARRKTQA